MNETPQPLPDSGATFRRQLYFLMILVSAGLMFGRIIALDNVHDQSVYRIKSGMVPRRLEEKRTELEKKGLPEEQIKAALETAQAKLYAEAAQTLRPFLSANDRSRWCTIRALVEPDMRVVDESGKTIWFAIDKVQTLPGWDTIDMVKHPLPPSNPEAPAYLYSSKPPLLPAVMSIPYYLLYHGSAGRISFATDPYFVVRSMLVLINLLPIVFCWFLMGRLIERFGTTDWSRLFVMSFLCFGTFASTFVNTLNNHSPGICCLIISLYAAVRILFDGRRELRYFLIAGFFASMMLACELPALSYIVLLLVILLWAAPKQTLCGYVPMLLIVFAAFFATNEIAHQTWKPAYANEAWYKYTFERGGIERLSYWHNRVGIDNGEKTIPAYLFNTTLGHHGIFSLTPVWALSFFGLLFWLFQRKNPKLFCFAISILLLSVVCYVFYLTQPQNNRNYGGMTSGLRWMFWFIPLWTLAMLPLTDRLSKFRLGRGLALVLLFFSIVSVAYPLWNPWDHPWLYHWMRYLGWTVIT